MNPRICIFQVNYFLILEQGLAVFAKRSTIKLLLFDIRFILSSIQLISMCLLRSLLGTGNKILTNRVPALKKFGV